VARTSRLDGERLREWARIGAEETLRRLRAEIVAIERTFPELKLPRRRREVRRAVRQASATTYTMSTEARASMMVRESMRSCTWSEPVGTSNDVRSALLAHTS
jgi:hypothetical protein